jgi:hypothetical protein
MSLLRRFAAPVLVACACLTTPALAHADGPDGGGYWDPIPPVIHHGRTVAGTTAMLRPNGQAAIPRRAPRVVRSIIKSANRIIGKPYKWGGGHAKLEDKGYDCSGTVSYALIGARALTYPMVSGSFARWGERGPGRWVTIYANAGHVYMEVAGLRLDTSGAGDYWGEGSGVRWRPLIGRLPKFRVRHPAGL